MIIEMPMDPKNVENIVPKAPLDLTRDITKFGKRW
jgi:hypothetical protein